MKARSFLRLLCAIALHDWEIADEPWWRLSNFTPRLTWLERCRRCGDRRVGHWSLISGGNGYTSGKDAVREYLAAREKREREVLDLRAGRK